MCLFCLSGISSSSTSTSLGLFHSFHLSPQLTFSNSSNTVPPALKNPTQNALLKSSPPLNRATNPPLPKAQCQTQHRHPTNNHASPRPQRRPNPRTSLRPRTPLPKHRSPLALHITNIRGRSRRRNVRNIQLSKIKQQCS